MPTHDDLAALGNLLRYADAALNIASTTALDAAVVDTPVVCVGFHDTAEPREAAFYLEAHLSNHFQPIVASGGAPLARDMGELRALLAEAVLRPEARRDARRRLVADLCGRVDGHAAERIAQDLTRLAGAEAPASAAAEDAQEETAAVIAGSLS
jgi:hypothetical protein